MSKINKDSRGKILILLMIIFLITGCASLKNTENKAQIDSAKSKVEWLDETRKEFDESAPSYDESKFQWGIFDPAHNLILKEVDTLKIHADARILDAASGTGKLTLRLAERVPQGEIIGLDLAPKMVEEANKKVKDLSNIKFIVGNVESIPFPDNYFDIVTCSYSFHHFPDSALALEEMKRVLKDGGMLYIIDPYRSFPFLFSPISKWLEDNVKFYTAKEFLKLFNDRGFKDVYQKRQIRRLGLFEPGLLTVGKAEKK